MPHENYKNSPEHAQFSVSLCISIKLTQALISWIHNKNIRSWLEAMLKYGWLSFSFGKCLGVTTENRQYITIFSSYIVHFHFISIILNKYILDVWEVGWVLNLKIEFPFLLQIYRCKVAHHLCGRIEHFFNILIN